MKIQIRTFSFENQIEKKKLMRKTCQKIHVIELQRSVENTLSNPLLQKTSFLAGKFQKTFTFDSIRKLNIQQTMINYANVLSITSEIH